MLDKKSTKKDIRLDAGIRIEFIVDEYISSEIAYAIINSENANFKNMAIEERNLTMATIVLENLKWDEILSNRDYVVELYMKFGIFRRLDILETRLLAVLGKELFDELTTELYIMTSGRSLKKSWVNNYEDKVRIAMMALLAPCLHRLVTTRGIRS